MRASVLLSLASLSLAACVTKIEYVDGDGGPFECAEGFTLCAASPSDGVDLDAGRTSYAVECVDLQRDGANCGACGNASCGARGCVKGKCGKCIPPGGMVAGKWIPCESNADCCSGKCPASGPNQGRCE